MSIKNIDYKEVSFNLRQIGGQAILSFLSISYIVSNLKYLHGYAVYGIAAVVIGLVLYFTNKK